MFDLNLRLDSDDDDQFNANSCDGWSRETLAANGERETSSSYDDTCSRRASSGSGGDAVAAFNFDKSKNSDQGLTSSDSGLVIRDLFPVSRPDGMDRGWWHDEPAAPMADQARLLYSLPQVGVHQKVQPVQAVQVRKSRRGPRSRSSQYRGVTFYRRTGRWESHIWDGGKQVYLGGFDTALGAARAYDRAAIKFRGVEADVNFNLRDYDDVKQMMNLSKEEFVQTLRRQSNGFSRGSCKYRGVGLNSKCGRWDARTGEHLGMKASDLDLNLGMSASWKLQHVAQTTRTLKGIVTWDPPLEGVPVRSQHPSFVPKNEEREMADLGWRMQGHDPTAPNAASSGFSSQQTAPNTLASYSSWIKP